MRLTPRWFTAWLATLAFLLPPTLGEADARGCRGGRGHRGHRRAASCQSAAPVQGGTVGGGCAGGSCRF